MSGIVNADKLVKEDGEELELQLWSVTYQQFSASLKILEKTGTVRGSRAVVFQIWQWAIAAEDCCQGTRRETRSFPMHMDFLLGTLDRVDPQQRGTCWRPTVRSNDHGSRPVACWTHW